MIGLLRGENRSHAGKVWRQKIGHIIMVKEDCKQNIFEHEEAFADG